MSKTFNKLLSVVLTVAMLFSLASTAFAQDEAAFGRYSEQALGNFEYKKSTDDDCDCWLVEYSGMEQNKLVVPGTYRNKPVALNGSTFDGAVNYFSKLVISEGTKHLTGAVLEDCDYLTEIYISSTVEKITSSVFRNCQSLRKIIVDENNPYFSSIDGVLFSKDGTKLLACPSGKNVSAYTVPQGVTEIAPYAFWNNENICTVVLPDGIKSIGDHAFVGTVDNVIIPTSLERIDAFAFSYSGSVTVYYEGTKEQWEQVENHSYVEDDITNKVVLFEQTENLPVGNDPNEAEKDKEDDEALQNKKFEVLFGGSLGVLIKLPAAGVLISIFMAIMTVASAFSELFSGLAGIFG